MEKKFDENSNGFSKALGRLEQALLGDLSEDLHLDGLLHRFEITFGQSLRVMRFYLKQKGLLEEMDTRNTIRCAYKHGLIEKGDTWIQMMLDRNITSHMYAEETSSSIVDLVKDKYISEFRELKRKLEL